MGSPLLVAYLWGLCHVLSHLPCVEGAKNMSCGPHSCSLNSCCLRLVNHHRQPMTCGCPPGMAPIFPNSTSSPNLVSCQALPVPATCKIPVLEEIRRECNKAGPDSPPCIRLQKIEGSLQSACAWPKPDQLNKTLTKLQGLVLNDTQAGTSQATQVLLQSTEALVLQAALQHSGTGPQNFSNTIMEAAAEVVRKDHCPQDTLVLTVAGQNLSIYCNEVVSDAQAGRGAVAFIVYKDGEKWVNGTTMEKLNSPVVSGTVGRPGVTFDRAVNITLQHNEALQAGEDPRCMSWNPDTKDLWTDRGCERVGGDASYSVCACTHFSTFAILMGIHQESFALKMITYVGMSVSLVCLFLTILTFLLCRSLWSVSVALHLQLSICLFAANLLFLVAVNHTTNRLVCAITAGFLHYLFLACFAWMFLEGLHLFLTVRNLSVLNYTSASRFRKRYIYPVGYGTPAIVVAISAAVQPGGYGTKHYCWLSMERGFIWTFLGPICVIILVNLLFFLITLWTLRDKLSALNADVTALKKNRLMTFKALAHIIILGCTWGLGLLQAQGDNIVVAFIFTIINSLQGAIIFLVHCVLNRQVTEQYRRWFRALWRQPHPQEMPSTEVHVTYVTEGERPQSHSTEGCTWEK